MNYHPCPVCGCLTLEEIGGYEICPVCFWEDDGDRDPDSKNSANEGLTFLEGRENFLKYGAFHEKFKDRTRKPEESEITEYYLELISNNPSLPAH